MSGADWMDALRAACSESSRRSVGERLGLSPATLSLVLNGRYPAALTKVEAKVRAELMGNVTCPVLGKLPRQRCRELQSRPFAATNPQRVKLHVACTTCQHGGRS